MCGLQASFALWSSWKYSSANWPIDMTKWSCVRCKAQAKIEAQASRVSLLQALLTMVL